MNRDALWLLERIRLGEVPPHLAERARRLLEDPEAAARLQGLEALDAADRQAHPAAAQAAEILRVAAARDRTEAAARRSSRRRAWGIGVPALATLALGLALWPAMAPRPTGIPLAEGPHPTVREAGVPLPREAAPPRAAAETSPPPAPSGNPGAPMLAQAQPLPPPEVALLPAGVRAKGEPVTLLVHRKDAGHARRLADGDTVFPHQVLQLSVQSSRRAHAWILSRDASGELTVHLPENGTGSSPVDTGLHALPHAWELDESSGFERFWIVWGETPFPTAALEKAARALPRDATALPLPPGLHQRTVLLVKSSR